MKTKSVIAAMLLTACSGSYRIQNHISNIPETCPRSKYLITMSKWVGPDKAAELTAYNLLKETQARHGAYVTIHNIRWDVQGGKKVSAIWDVLECDTSAVRR